MLTESYWDGKNWLKVIEDKSSTKYYLDEKVHRNNGPAVIAYLSNGGRFENYYYHGKKYRENGPEEILYYEDGNIMGEIYCFNELCHREDGPAIIWFKKNGSKVYYYYFNGIEFDPENLPFDLPINTKEKEFLFKLKYGEQNDN